MKVHIVCLLISVVDKQSGVLQSSKWKESLMLAKKEQHADACVVSCVIYIRGANLSPFGEIRRFHLEIGHSRESCRSVKKKERKKMRRGGGGSSSDLQVICVTSPAALFPLLAMAGMDPPYSVSDWLTLGSCLVFSL